MNGIFRLRNLIHIASVDVVICRTLLCNRPSITIVVPPLFMSIRPRGEKLRSSLAHVLLLSCPLLPSVPDVSRHGEFLETCRGTFCSVPPHFGEHVVLMNKMLPHGFSDSLSG